MAIEGDPGPGKIDNSASHSTLLLANEMIATQICPFGALTILNVGAAVPLCLVTKIRLRGGVQGVHLIPLRIMASVHLMAFQVTALLRLVAKVR